MLPTNESAPQPMDLDAAGAEARESASSSNPRPSAVQLFVRNLDSRTTVIRARPEETVEDVLDSLDKAVGRRSELRLVYASRSLPAEATIGELRLPPDATLHVNSRLRSAVLPDSWYLASKIVTTPAVAAGTGVVPVDQLVRSFLTYATTLERTKEDKDFNRSIAEHLDVFLRSGAAGVLVSQYLSTSASDRGPAERAIRFFLVSNTVVQVWSAPILMEFCRLIALGAGRSDPLYRDCRGMLAMVLTMPNWQPPPLPDHPRGWAIFLLAPIARDLVVCVMDQIAVGSWSATVARNLAELKLFFSVLRREVRALFAAAPPCSSTTPATRKGKRKSDLLQTISFMLRRAAESMDSFELAMPRPPSRRKRAALPAEQPHTECVISLWAVLAELDAWTGVHRSIAVAMRDVLAKRRTSLDALVLCVGRDRSPGIYWIVKHKDLLAFEARRHLAMALMPEPESGESALPLHEMLIDRSQLLSDSFGYITLATRDQLRATQFVEFKHEDATGPGVMREWLCLVFHALFSPEQVLFSPCPRDRRRFFVNPASVADPLHLNYFEFAGKIVGLALMHNMQVGIYFDRTLFMQLAGRRITLGDIADADPCLHASCKQILEMDAGLVDSDALGLTFAREVEVVGSRKLVELIPRGNDIAVDSKNRRNYIDLLIKDRFVNCTKNQIAHFELGFSQMLLGSQFGGAFFASLDLEDFNLMLGGSSSNIDVKDWKGHTEYRGYKAKDDQINWFWKVVESMTIEQRRRLLFFWTSVKYLSVDGFCGLTSRLVISRALYETPDHLPSSHTCFYSLNLPYYTSFNMMQSRLQMIVQEHVSSSFGEV